MNEEQFGTTSDYLEAFKAIRAEGISDHHVRMLRAHLSSPGYATTWAQLAQAVNYHTGSGVNLHYGK